MNKNNFKTPILFLIFNRPDTTQIVFNEIKKIKPSKLYVAADGPRQDNENDKINCLEVRNIIEQQIDWDCEVKKLFREKNLGCKIAVSSAINWFFENEEMGIILEDDCLPDKSFFYFCEELLNKYKNDERVMMISGLNYFNNKLEIEESYFFANYPIIWGWASWRRAWEKYKINMDNWEEFYRKDYLNYIYNNKRFVKFVQSLFDATIKNIIDTWDIQWYYSILINNGLCIIPKYNLVMNIGVTGTHVTEKSKVHYMPIKEIDIHNIIHPKLVLLDYKYNKMLINKIVAGLPKSKFKNFLIRIPRIPRKILNISKTLIKKLFFC